MAWFKGKGSKGFSADALKRKFKSWRPSLEVLEDRTVPFVASGGTWGAGALVTYSLMNSGIALDGGENSAALNTFMNAAEIERVREALLYWSQFANINFTQVADGGEAFDAPGGATIRIAGHGNFAASVLAHAWNPPPAIAGGRAGDVHFDTADAPWGTGRFLFNTAAHEFGHAIGLDHEPAAGNQALMNPSIDTSFIGLLVDDINGIQSIYGAAQIANLVVSANNDPEDGNQAGDGIGDTFRVFRRGGNLEITINGNYAYSVNAATLNSITINGSSDNDTLIVDQSAGWITQSIVFNGGGQTTGTFGDTLRFDGGAFNNVTHSFTNSNSGFVSIDGVVHQYNGLEPIFDNMNVVDRVFNFNNNSSDITLQNDVDQPGGPFAGWSQISSVADSEIVFFTNATNSLTVNAGGGDDVINLFPTIDPVYATPNTFINGDGGTDRVFVQRVAQGTNLNIDTGASGATDDQVFIGIAPNQAFNAGFGNLDNILGNVNVEDSGGIGQLFVDDSSDANGMNFFIDVINNVPIYGGPGFRINPVLLPGFINFTDDIERFELATGNGSELVEFDFNGSNPISGVLPDQGVFVDLNGGNNDLLRFVDGVSDVVTYFADDTDGNLATHEGRVNFDGVNVSYAGLEPIVDTTFANTRIFTLNTGNVPQDIRIHDEGVVGNQINRIDTNGQGGFEQIDFLNPALQLIVNGNDNVNTILLCNTLDAFIPVVTLNGLAGNDIFYVQVVSPFVITQVFVNGGAPVAGDPGVPPGDVLVVDAPGATVVPTGSPNGQVLTPAGVGVTFTSIETVIVPDRFELNNTLATATVLGSDAWITLRDLSIHSINKPGNPPSTPDIDYFRYTAHETGYLIVNALFTHFPGGDIDLEIRDENDVIIASSTGVVNNERIVIPVVGQRQYWIRVNGFNNSVNNYALEIENFGLPVPTSIDLNSASDSGRSNVDDITNVTTPTITINADLSGLAAQGITILNSAQAAARDTGAAVQVFLDGVSVGFATAIAGTNNTRFTFTFAAGQLGADGIKSVTAAVRVWDPRPLATRLTDRGQMSPAFQFELDTVYTAPNPNIFTSVVLTPADDTGVPTDPATFQDRITRTRSPRFNGLADANAWVRIEVDGVLYGQAQAIPIDGNQQEPRGYWTLSTGLFNLADGLHTVTARAFDVAGNLEAITAANTVQIFIDNQSPLVTDVVALDANGDPIGNDLLLGKLPGFGPTPAVWGLQLNITDLPDRVAQFLYNAVNPTTVNTGTIVLRGQRVGLINPVAIQVINTLGVGPGQATITLTFAQPLPDDIYTIEIRDTVTDDPGNRLLFINGSNIATFKVDSAPEIGTFAGGSINIDLNGNYIADSNGQSNGNGDVLFRYSPNGASVFAGQFVTAADKDPVGGFGNDFFDRIGLYGRLRNRLTWQLDFDNNGTWDFTGVGLQVNGTPVAGDFNANPFDGSEVGLFTGNKWYFDINRFDFSSNNVIDAGDVVLSSTMRGLPFIGDFDGDGFVDLGTFQNDRFYFDLSTEGAGNFGPAGTLINGRADRVMSFGFTTRLDRPVAADFDGDGFTDVGLFVPGRSTQINAATAEWFFVVSNIPGGGVPVYERFPNFDFNTEPFGADFTAAYGNPRALPLVGNFDPPVTGVQTTQGGAGAGTGSSGSGLDGSTLASLGADQYFAIHGWRRRSR